MTTKNNNYIGNITTIVKYICMVIAGYALGLAISYGLNLPVSQEQLSEIIFAIIVFIIGYLDSKYPNTFAFLGNKKEPCECQYPKEPLNQEYNGE